jgi:hypothetical protein
MMDRDGRHRRLEVILARIQMAVQAASERLQGTEAMDLGRERLEDLRSGIAVTRERIRRARESIANGRYDDAEAQIAEAIDKGAD